MVGEGDGVFVRFDAPAGPGGADPVLEKFGLVGPLLVNPPCVLSPRSPVEFLAPVIPSEVVVDPPEIRPFSLAPGMEALLLSFWQPTLNNANVIQAATMTRFFILPLTVLI